MREKPPLEKTIEKYIQFLKAVKEQSKDFTEANYVSIEELIKQNSVNKSAGFAIIKLKLIERSDKLLWTWEAGDPGRPMALKVLDYLLHRRKDQQPALNPEWVTIIEKLTTISQDLKELLKPQIDVISDSDIKKEMRFELIKSIAGGVFNSHDSLNEYQSLGHRIITAADHILSEMDSERFKK